ncbi:cupredoxin domain-containing protein [Aquibacillus saliphilus]|uniref:cupredoxin domain-containing protein n=1 Tax=Aquibacillus saliphilus TaxID=1909422 RepID=UPI001CF090BD|nr:cupredoxin domain-containing protein [Aquibacillus saliphilus]
MKKSLLTLITVGLIVFLTACGGGENSDDTVQNEAADGNEGQVITMTASNFEFDQAEYTVSKGEPVTINFTTEEGMHGIGIDEFGVKIQGDGSATFTPEEPGEYVIYCNIACGTGHSQMKSTLIVQ